MTLTITQPRYPLTLIYLAGLEFGRRDWEGYSLAMSNIIKQNSHNGVLKGDVLRYFEGVRNSF
jgi:hypothetical protein